MYSNNAMKFTDDQHGTTVLEKIRIQQEEQRCCDVLVHVAGEEFEAHKSVLAASSPYFDSLFKERNGRGFKEQVKISCEDPNIFHSILGYIYSGTVIITSTNAPELLKIAHELLLDKLINYCAEYLQRYINIHNCLGLHHMAEKFKLDSLIKGTKNFIKLYMSDIIDDKEILRASLNTLEEFIDCPDWKLNDMQILNLVSSWVYHNIEDRVQSLRSLLTWITWRHLHPNQIIDLLNSHRLYKISKIAIFFLLDALNDNGALPVNLHCLHKDLKANFDLTTDPLLDGERFMNYAVETAIRKIPDEDPSCTAAPPKSQFSFGCTPNSFITEGNNERIKHEENLFLISQDSSEHIPKPLYERGPQRSVDCTLPTSPSTSEQLNNFTIPHALNPRVLNPAKVETGTESGHENKYQIMNVDNHASDSNDDSCSFQVHPKHLFNEKREGGFMQDVSYPLQIKKEDHHYKEFFHRESFNKYLQNYSTSVQDSQESNDTNDGCNFNTKLTKSGSNVEPNTSGYYCQNASNIPLNFQMSNSPNQLEATISNYYMDSVMDSQARNLVNDNSCDTQMSNCPQDMSMSQLTLDNKRIQSKELSDLDDLKPTMEKGGFRDMNHRQHIVEDNRFFRPIHPEWDYSQDKADCRQSPANILQIIPEEEYSSIDNNLDPQRQLIFDNGENIVKHQIQVNALDDELHYHSNTNFPLQTIHNPNSNSCILEQSLESSNFNNMIIDEDYKSNDDTACDLKIHNRNEIQETSSELHAKEFPLNIDNDSRFKTGNKISVSNQSIPETVSMNPDDVPRNVKFRIVKNVENFDKSNFNTSELKSSNNTNNPKQSSQPQQQEDQTQTASIKPKKGNLTPPKMIIEKHRICDMCNLTFKENKSYFRHMKDHFPGPPHPCDKCKKSFKRIYHLLGHRVTHEERRAHACPHNDCSYSSHRLSNLKEHMKNHDVGKTHICKTCGSCFARLKWLKRHMTKHTDDRPYLCELCGLSCKTKNLLQIHTKIHTGDLYSCQYQNCAYRTPKRSHLKDHMQTHSRSKPYKCQKCSKCFGIFSVYHRHLKSHAEPKLHCTQCNYSTYRTDRLHIHIKKKHEIKTEKPIQRKHHLKKKDALISYFNNKIQDEGDFLSEFENTNLSLKPQLSSSPPPATLSEYPSSSCYPFEQRSETVDDPLPITEIDDFNKNLFLSPTFTSQACQSTSFSLGNADLNSNPSSSHQNPLNFNIHEM